MPFCPKVAVSENIMDIIGFEMPGLILFLLHARKKKKALGLWLKKNPVVHRLHYGLFITKDEL